MFLPILMGAIKVDLFKVFGVDPDIYGLGENYSAGSVSNT